MSILSTALFLIYVLYNYDDDKIDSDPDSQIVGLFSSSNVGFQLLARASYLV